MTKQQITKVKVPFREFGAEKNEWNKTMSI